MDPRAKEKNMNQDRALEIANAKKHIDTVQKMNEKFLKHAKANATSKEVPSKLEFDAQKIKISCFIYEAVASPRIVKDKSGDFSMEYVFVVKLDEETHEVWRFYLSSHGKITKTLDTENGICDYDNIYIAKIICSHVLTGTLQSALFDPLLKQVD